MTNTDIKTACLYVRYSSTNQSEQSIEGQTRVCQEFCKRNNINITKIYADRATSASKDIEKRVEFLRMIKDSEKHNFDAVIVYKLDRFARSRYDSAHYKYKLKKNGVRLISATENISNEPEGIILESVIEGMAEYYSVELSQKVNRGLAESALKHNTTGGSYPLGYTSKNKKYVIDEEKAKIVREAFTLYANGNSVAEICRLFNKKGYKTSKGANFGRSSFSRLLRNEKYIGTYMYKDYKAENAIPAIIDKNLFDVVQYKLNSMAKAPGRAKAHTLYLLSGKLFCGHCGCNMNANRTYGNGKTYHFYTCYGKKNYSKNCTKKNLNKQYIENLVVQDALSLLTDEYIEQLAETAMNASIAEINKDENLTKLRIRLKEIESSLSNIMTAIETGQAPEILVKRMIDLEKESKSIKSQIKKEEKNYKTLDKEQVIFWLNKFKDGDVNDERFCQSLIDLLIDSVTVWDEPHRYYKITIAYNLTSTENKTYRVDPDGRLKFLVSVTNAPVLSAKPNIVNGVLYRTNLYKAPKQQYIKIKSRI